MVVNHEGYRTTMLRRTSAPCPRVSSSRPGEFVSALDVDLLRVLQMVLTIPMQSRGNLR
jgi:hypothetical protein